MPTRQNGQGNGPTGTSPARIVPEEGSRSGQGVPWYFSRAGRVSTGKAGTAGRRGGLEDLLGLCMSAVVDIISDMDRLSKAMAESRPSSCLGGPASFYLTVRLARL